MENQSTYDVRFNTVSIIVGGKDSTLNSCSHRHNRTPWPSCLAGSACQKAEIRVDVLIAVREFGNTEGHKIGPPIGT